MNNLVPLFEEALEFQNFNGSVLSNGKVKVYFIGRTSLADIYNDVAGEYPSENPKILNNLGMGPIYVNPAFDYEIVVYDEYDNELFSVKKYLHSNGAHSTSNVEVVPSENIQVSAWTQGDVQVYMPYITGNLGKVYSGVEPIVVNNDEDKISANHVPLGLQEPLYFVEDSESACVIGIDSSACGKTYSGISPILVDNTANTISITGDIGKDWTEEILSAADDASAAATAWANSQGYLTSLPDDLVYTGDLNDYAKKDFVLSSIDSSTSGLLPTSAFATASASFLTALPSDLISSQSGTIFVSGYEIEGTNSAVTTATVQGFVTSFEEETIGPSLTATFGWDKSLPNATFTFTTNYPSGPALVTYSANTNLTGEIMAPGFTATKFDVSIPDATAIRLWSNNWVSLIDNVASAADSVGMTVGELAWASALPTYQYDSSNKISAINGSALANYELPTSVSAATDAVTANSAIWNSVTGKLETTAFSTVSSDFLTALPSDVAYTGWVENSIVSATSGLQSSGNYIPYTATEDSLTAFVTNSGLIVDHTAVGDGLKSTYIGGNVQVGYVGPHSTNRWAILSNNQLKFETDSNGAYDSAYLDKEKIHKLDSASDYIQNNSATINDVTTSYQTNSGSFLTAVDLTPYQTTAGMTAYQSAGDYYSASNPSGFLVADDITGKLDASVYAADSGSFLTAVPDTYLQNTDLTITDGKVTEISGVPLSAGDELPSGVMNTSALEYNAVNEISGYNGSAIAQYGAEKQWLVHDDTLVHAANSAQYALGVNLSAVAQLLGVDETVLYSGNRTQSAVLSDSIWNYNRIGIYAGANGQNIANYQIFDTVDISSNGNIIMLQNTFNFEGASYYSFVTNYSALDNGTTLYSVGADGIAVNTAVEIFKDNKNLGCIKKVIGICRKN